MKITDHGAFESRYYEPYDEALLLDDQNHRPREPRIRLIAFDDIKLGTEPQYLVKNLVPRTGLVIVWGPPKCGKSFWTFDLVMHVALGWEYRGRKVQRGTVVYCAFEGQKGFEQRVVAFRQRFLAQHRDPVPFYLQPLTLDLVVDRKELITAVREQANGTPVAVVLDTLNRSLRGSESSDEDMTAYIRAADAIREAFGCVVIIVHHCGIEGTRPRGHTSLTGAADVQISVKRDPQANIIVKVEYMKDGPEGDEIVSRLDPVKVGTDTDGDEITSRVVVPAERDSTAKGPKLSDTNKLGLSILRDLISTAGKLAEPDNKLPANTRVVSAFEWRERFYKAYPSDKPDTKQKAFVRVSLKLEELGLTRISGAWAWMPDKPDNPDKSEK
jgi:hypothetical protein